ncbi:MAG: acetyl-CoA carboxylase, carboxyltransferase subunit beta [Eggerthellales bacterium]|nr:acetyl-CoA carboxylase, carboxyltransferase subunit beta [Eggerthellales bacterium]
MPSNPFTSRHLFLQAVALLKPKAQEEAKRQKNMTMTCPSCKATHKRKHLVRDQYVCPACGCHLKMPATARLQSLFDNGAYDPLFDTLVGADPINFPGYADKVDATREKSGLTEAVVCGRGLVGNVECVACAFDASFFMGSMGEAVGERVTRAVETATAEGLPLVIFSLSGGARMQEGIFSLMQMAKTAAAVRRHADAGLLYVSVLTNPTTGGVLASFASLGDIIIAEPEALIGFAGPRVIEQTIRQKLPEGFQRSEYLFERGFIDRIVPRQDLNKELRDILALHAGKAPKKDKAEGAAGTRGNDSSHSGDTGRKGYTTAANGNNAAASADTVPAQALCPVPQAPISASARVALARDKDRPKADFYISQLFDNFMELHGDRHDKDDPCIKGGIAWFHGQPVTVIAQCKGTNLQENLTYNFGMPNPQGYRKAMRLAEQAEKFGRPIVTIIDTPGAYPGIEAEEKGQGEAIAQSIALFSGLKVPVVALFIGEGGSGGALALSVADSLIMLENAVFSILSPEGFASILWRDASRAAEAAEHMGLTAPELLEYGVADQVIPEGSQPLQAPCPETVSLIDQAISGELKRLGTLSSEELVNARYEKFRHMGTFAEGTNASAAGAGAAATGTHATGAASKQGKRK